MTIEYEISPFCVTLEQIMGKLPTGLNLHGITYSEELSEDDYDVLVNWCSYNTPVPWWTGVSIIEAVDGIVADAIGNGNLGG